LCLVAPALADAPPLIRRGSASCQGLERLCEPFGAPVAAAGVVRRQRSQGSVDFWRRRGDAQGGALAELQLHHRFAAQIAVDARAQGPFLMGQEQGRAGRGAQGQGAAGGSFRKPQWLGKAGDGRPGNLVPAQHQAGIAEAGADESESARGFRIHANGTGTVMPLRGGVLYVFGRSGHGPIMSSKAKKSKPGAGLSRSLLAWYDIHRRVLPWRAAKGKPADPYRVWLSEIMLQQTTVQAVGNYYR